MATLGDVLAAIDRVERAGRAGELTTSARLQISTPLLSARDYDLVLQRLRGAYPDLFRPAAPAVDSPVQRGEAVEAMKKAEAALSGQQSAVAEFDRQVIEALLHAHTATAAGRRRLDELEQQIEHAAQARDPSTAAGAREFQRFLISKLREIVAVVQDTDDDDVAKQALAAAWTALYASQSGVDAAPAGAPDPPAPGSPEPSVAPGGPTVPPYLGGPDPEYPEGGYDAPVESARAARIPEVAPISAGGPPEGLSSGGGLPGLLQRLSPDRSAPVPPAADHPASGPAWLDEADPADSTDEEADDEAGQPAEPNLATDPRAATLPDGAIVTAATPELAAVIDSAARGALISDAFRAQGIVIPPPGSAVSVPVDISHLVAGDVGVFTDRHALAVGGGRALLDGEIHRVADIGGPSFLGWQHPPVPGDRTGAPDTATQTRPSAAIGT